MFFRCAFFLLVAFLASCNSANHSDVVGLFICEKTGEYVSLLSSSEIEIGWKSTVGVMVISRYERYRIQSDGELWFGPLPSGDVVYGPAQFRWKLMNNNSIINIRSSGENLLFLRKQ